jgi:SAM-dependent methyltransferase
MREVCTRLSALEIDSVAVDEMLHDGFDAIVGNAEDFELNEKFDVVFAGEIIEHLVDLRGFFRSAAAVLEEDGVLVITTPNVFKVSTFLYRLGKRTPPINPDHKMWFCEQTLRALISDRRFEVLSLIFIDPPDISIARRVIKSIFRLILPDRLLSSTLLVVAKPQTFGVTNPN